MEQFKVVEPRTLKESQFILSEQNFPIKYEGNEPLCTKTFETPRYFLAMRNWFK